MDKQGFENALPKLNLLLVENLNVQIEHNYMRNSSISSFIFLRVQLPDTEEFSERIIELTIHFDSFYLVPVLYYRQNYFLEASPFCAMEIHPILQTPFYYWHPCETRDTMATIPYNGYVDYLIKWIGIAFSVVLPELQLRIATNRKR